MNVTILYNDFTRLEADSAKLADVTALVKTEFPDDTCQIKAIKAVLGIEDNEEEVTP